MQLFRYILFASFGVLASAQKIVLTNDDGWAVAQIRAEVDALADAGYKVILSSPTQNWSGSGSLSVPALPNVKPCQFDSCPAFSPPYGWNKSDIRLNYVNAAPADASHHGVTSLARESWGEGVKPDLVVSGPNVGNNLGYAVFTSGTIGAASRAVSDGVPAVAFSGSSKSTAQEAWTLLTSSPAYPSILAARAYASLTTHFLSILFSHRSGTDPTLLPQGILLNVNFPPISPTCPGTPETIKWVFTRALPALVVLGWVEKHDVETCGNGGRLPTEESVIAVSGGCYATVSALDASSKTDADDDVQANVLRRLAGLRFSCLPTTSSSRV